MLRYNMCSKKNSINQTVRKHAGKRIFFSERQSKQSAPLERNASFKHNGEWLLESSTCRILLFRSVPTRVSSKEQRSCVGIKIAVWETIASIKVACEEGRRCMQTCWFPQTYEQRGSLVVVWALCRLLTKLPDILKVAKPKQDRSSPPFLKFVFIDCLVHKSLFTRGFWLATTENT